MVGATDSWSPSCFTNDIDKNTNYDTCIETTVKQGIRAFYFTIAYDKKNTNNDLKCYVTNSFDNSNKHSNILLQDVLVSLVNYAFSSTSCKNSDDMLIIYLYFKKPYPKSNFIPFDPDIIANNSNRNVIVTDENILKAQLSKLNTTRSKIVFLTNIDTANVYDGENYNIIHNLSSIGIDPQEYTRTLNTNNFTLVTHNSTYVEDNIMKNGIKGIFFGKISIFVNESPCYLQTIYGNIGEKNTTAFIVDTKNNEKKYVDNEPEGCLSSVITNFTINNQRLGTKTTYN